MRNILNIRYPDIISNNELHEKTKQNKWSGRIEQRRLRFYGHILRLPEETLVRQALQEFRNPHKRPRGAPKLTWQKRIDKDLTNT